MARRHLPRNYSDELPRLLSGHSAGLPRVYDIVLELISHVDAQVDDSALTAIGNHSSGVVLSGAPLELVLHAFGRRQAADIGIQGSADATRSFAEWSAQK